MGANGLILSWNRTLQIRVVFPETIDEVVALVRLANRERIALVPSGGRTGLSGGAVDPNNLSTEVLRYNALLHAPTWSVARQAVKGGTELRMVHSNVPAEQADSYRQGWIDHYWTPLKAYFAQR